MVVLQGTGVSKGIAVGILNFCGQKPLNIVERKLENTVQEVQRFESARALAITQLGKLASDTAAKLGKQNSLLFEIHQMMLEDIDYHDTIVDYINDNKVCAEYAVNEVAKQFSQMFAEMDDEYMKARAVDVHDVSRRIIEILMDIEQKDSFVGKPSVLAGDDFTPSETAQFDREKVLGIATVLGSKNSHTAIFARTLAIPAVIALGESLEEKYNGCEIILDGETGEVIVDPDEKTMEEKLLKKKVLEEEEERLVKFKGKKTLSKSGKELKLYANIGSVADAEAAIENDAEGIGLFRSEFLYLESSNYPTEDEQFKAYSEVAKKMQGKSVIIRTLDIGADKQASYFELPAEENPAMGLRALRICLERPDVFKTQVKALLRAAVFGNIQIMLPMVTSLWEVKRAKEIIEDAKSEMIKADVKFSSNVPLGIMIETPAAAVISDILAKEVDFFSIGTNDLTQYMLAVDRQNESIERYCDTHHEAILRMIELTTKNAHANGIWVGICGELGADLNLTEFFVKIGIDELSVTPSEILTVREKVSLV